MTNPENMYTPVSSTTYASMTNTNASTSYYYCYIRGFNISDIPPNAEVSSFTVKLKGCASGAYNSAMYLCHGTTTIASATATQIPNSSSATTRTFSNGALTWADIAGYGSDFGIRINCRRNAKNTQSYYYIYGAELEVTYTPQETKYTITASSAASGAELSPTSAEVLEGEGLNIQVIANSLNRLILTDNGVDVTSQIQVIGTGWYYSLSNIQTDHALVLAYRRIFLKDGGTWVEATRIYKKVNGAWVEQTDLSGVFVTGTQYIHGVVTETGGLHPSATLYPRTTLYPADSTGYTVTWD